jgi:hypothetical protein
MNKMQRPSHRSFGAHKFGILHPNIVHIQRSPLNTLDFCVFIVMIVKYPESFGAYNENGYGTDSK